MLNNIYIQDIQLICDINNHSNDKPYYGLMLTHTGFQFEYGSSYIKNYTIFKFKNSHDYCLFKQNLKEIKNYIFVRKFGCTYELEKFIKCIIKSIDYYNNNKNKLIRLNKINISNKDPNIMFYGVIYYKLFNRKYLTKSLYLGHNQQLINLSKKDRNRTIYIINNIIKETTYLYFTNFNEFDKFIKTVIYKYIDMTKLFKELTEYVYEPKRVEQYMIKYSFEKYIEIFN